MDMIAPMGDRIPRQRNRGVAMLLVLLAVVMAAVVSLSLISTQSTSTGVQDNIRNHTQARPIAEAAIEMAVAYIENDDDWRSTQTEGVWLSNQALNGGMFTLTGIDGDETGGDRDG